MDKNVISQERKTELEKELHELQNVKRKEIITALEYAKSLGDLSENAEYHEAREAQGKLEDRIREIEHILKTSTVFAGTTATKHVSVGNTVKLMKLDTKEEKTFTLVGPQDADISLGKISITSPLGSAILDKEANQEVTFNTPKGMMHYTILSFS